jgi:hypothetical protein
VFFRPAHWTSAELLGRFLEIAHTTADPHGDWELCQRLGFAAAETGDIWSHPYGVVMSTGFALGLHGEGDESLSLYTVRPNVLELHRELEELGVQVETAQLGPDVFNQLSLRAPGGISLRVLEARSFTPPAEIPVRTLLGRFETLSLPVRAPEEAAEFWSRLAYAMRDANGPWQAVEVDGLPLAYHAASDCPDPVLVFRGDGLERDLPGLMASGMEISRSLPALAGTEHLFMRLKGGIRFLLLA